MTVTKSDPEREERRREQKEVELTRFGGQVGCVDHAA
jgi:hypothetical protein